MAKPIDWRPKYEQAVFERDTAMRLLADRDALIAKLSQEVATYQSQKAAPPTMLHLHHSENLANGDLLIVVRRP